MAGHRNSKVVLPDLHPKQQLAFDSEATAILYGGATRGGKSHLVRHALITWCANIPGLQCDIFRLHLDDVISNHMQGETSFPALLAPWVNDKMVVITQREIRFWNKSLITLEHCVDDRALSKHQGVAKHVRVFEEAAQIKERHLRWLGGWVTMSMEMRARVPPYWDGCFPRILYTSNPIGPSKNYFRKHFVKARPSYEIEEKGSGGFRKQYIPAKIDDNPSEDKLATIARMSEIGDDAVADALINENWDALIGEFFPQYDDETHTLPAFDVPSHWFRFCTFDWGHAEPFAVLWWCLSTGEGPVMSRCGKSVNLPKGALVCYREWYGAQANYPSKGLEMSNHEVANGILDRTQEEVAPVVITDSKPFQRTGQTYTIADEFYECGVQLAHGNTKRVSGWSQMKTRLAGKEGVPLLYFMEHCVACRDYVPALGRHKTREEDAEESGEATHICDAIRYACTTRPVHFAKEAKEKARAKFIRPKPMTPEVILKRVAKENQTVIRIG